MYYIYIYICLTFNTKTTETMKTKLTFVSNTGEYFARTKDFLSTEQKEAYINEMLRIYGNKCVKEEQL